MIYLQKISLLSIFYYNNRVHINFREPMIPQIMKSLRPRSSSSPTIDYSLEQQHLLEAQEKYFKAAEAKDDEAKTAAAQEIKQAVLRLKRNKNPNAKTPDGYSAQTRIGGFFGIGGSADPKASVVLEEKEGVGALLLGPRPLFSAAQVKSATHVSLEELAKKGEAKGVFILSMQNPAEMYDSDGNQHTFNSTPIPASAAEIKAKYPNITLQRIGLFDHTPISANSSPNTILSISELNSKLEALHQARMAGKLIYIHCWGGQERSVMAAAAYLMNYERMTLFEAMAKIKEKRSVAKGLDEQTKQFVGFLGSYFVVTLGKALTSQQDPLTQFLLNASQADVIKNLQTVFHMDWEHTTEADRKVVLENFNKIMRFVREHREDYESVRKSIFSAASGNEQTIKTLKESLVQHEQSELEMLAKLQHKAISVKMQSLLTGAYNLIPNDEAIQKFTVADCTTQEEILRKRIGQIKTEYTELQKKIGSVQVDPEISERMATAIVELMSVIDKLQKKVSLESTSVSHSEHAVAVTHQGDEKEVSVIAEEGGDEKVLRNPFHEISQSQPKLVQT